MLNVAIAVDSATDFGPRAAGVVSAACEEVIGDRRCPVASELPPGSVAAWYAIVHPDDRALSSLRIEFRDRTADGVLIEARSLAFARGDSQESRLASAGSVIAALVAAREGSPVRAPRRDEAAPAEAARPDWSLDLAALFVPALGGPGRWGGLADAHVGFLGRPFALVSARYAAHAGTPGFSWWTLSAGGGTRLGGRAARVHLEVSGEVVFERTRVTADRGAARDSAGENGWGGRAALGAVWAAWHHCGVVLGVDGTFVLPRIDVDVADQRAAHVPPVSLGASVGLRFQP